MLGAFLLLDNGFQTPYTFYTPPPYGGVGDSIMRDPDVEVRLKNIEGHVKGIQRMVGEGAYCIDVMHQIQAVQAALNKVNQMLLEDHMKSCVITAVQGDNAGERERVLREISEVYEQATKV